VLYGGVVAGLHVDAVALHFDIGRWLARFDRAWPAGSPAALSYRDRIAHGPRHALSRALRAGITLSGPARGAPEQA
jgi:hypothetical protein